jgi:hypothetical protein
MNTPTVNLDQATFGATMSDWQETYYENYYQEFDYYLKLWSEEEEDDGKSPLDKLSELDQELGLE